MVSSWNRGEIDLDIIKLVEWNRHIAQDQAPIPQLRRHPQVGGGGLNRHVPSISKMEDLRVDSDAAQYGHHRARRGQVDIAALAGIPEQGGRIADIEETVLMVKQEAGGQYRNGWHMAVQAVAAYLGVTRSSDGRLVLGDMSIPLNQFNDIKIDFSTIPRGYHFIHELAGISAYEFLNISFLNDENLRELRDWVADKIVVVGETSSFSSDWFDTPVGVIYGAEIIADTINTLLKGAPLRPAPLWAEAMTSLTVLLLVVWLGTGVRTPWGCSSSRGFSSRRDFSSSARSSMSATASLSA